MEYGRKGWGISNTVFLVQETKEDSTIDRNEKGLRMNRLLSILIVKESPEQGD